MNPPESTETRPDLLIDDVRRVRNDLSQRFNNDVAKLCEHLVEIEAEYASRVVTPRQEKRLPT
jgi:hypothetical protein